jgi:hypothetical protein
MQKFKNCDLQLNLIARTLWFQHHFFEARRSRSLNSQDIKMVPGNVDAHHKIFLTGSPWT